MSIKIKVYRQKSIESADFSAQEPRVMSSLSGERDLIDGYNLRTKEFPKGKDFYAMLASSAFGKDYWECTEFDQNGNFQQEGKNRRLAGKVIQLGVSYGMGAKLLAEGLNKKKQPGEALMTIDGAREMMDTFFGKFVALREWKDYNSERLETFGYMETALGRRRRLFDVWLPDYETKVFKTEEFEDVFFNIPNSVLVRNYNEEKVVARKFSMKSKFDQKKYAEEIDDNPEYFPKSNGGFKSRPRTQATNFCISGDTKIITKSGVVPVSSLSGKVEVWDGEKFTSGTVVKTGMRPHYRVIFYDGNYVDCSPDHPFCKITTTSRNKVWKKAGELKPNDMILRSSESFFEEKLVEFESPSLENSSHNRKNITFNSFLNRPYELGVLLGRMASDGSYSPGGKGNGIKWIVAEHEYSILPELRRCLSGFEFSEKTKDRSNKNRKELVWLVIHSKSLKLELELMGIKKRIPRNLWSSKEALRGFLRGMFDGDGGVNLSKNGGGNLTLVFGSGDFSEYSRDIQMALGCFGILSRVHSYQNRTNITIMKKDIKKFVDRIGFMNPEKNRRAMELYEGLGHESTYGDVSRVKEIIDLGEEIEMYDIVNTGSGYFSGNGVILHNCIQGSSAELTKRAMVSIYTHPDKKRLGLNLLAPVHDEILVEGYTEYRNEALKALSTCMSSSADGIFDVAMICDGVIETCWNLIHFTDKIKKEYKKNGQNFNEILENYEEIDPDCLRRIVDGVFDPETDVLVPKKNS